MTSPKFKCNIESVDKLMSYEACLEALRSLGNTYKGGLRKIRDHYEMNLGLDMPFLYPYADIDYYGFYLLPVQEGVLMLPYNEVSEVNGEVISMDQIRLISVKDLNKYAGEVERHAQAFCIYSKRLYETYNQRA